MRHGIEALEDFLELWDKGYRFTSDDDITFTEAIGKGITRTMTLPAALRNHNITLKGEKLPYEIIRQAFHYFMFLKKVEKSDQ